VGVLLLRGSKKVLGRHKAPLFLAVLKEGELGNPGKIVNRGVKQIKPARALQAKGAQSSLHKPRVIVGNDKKSLSGPVKARPVTNGG
jgi:hypothetical protein